MKNYGHIWQWGKSPEYTVNICAHWDYWALPLGISWHYFNDSIENKCYSINIIILCFCFNLEIWRWAK